MAAGPAEPAVRVPDDGPLAVAYSVIQATYDAQIARDTGGLRRTVFLPLNPRLDNIGVIKLVRLFAEWAYVVDKMPLAPEHLVEYNDSVRNVGYEVRDDGEVILRHHDLDSQREYAQNVLARPYGPEMLLLACISSVIRLDDQSQPIRDAPFGERNALARVDDRYAQGGDEENRIDESIARANRRVKALVRAAKEALATTDRIRDFDARVRAPYGPDSPIAPYASLYTDIARTLVALHS